MLSKHYWISEVQATLMHAEQIATHGGIGGIRDANLLQSALARPQQVFAFNPDTDLCALAPAYGQGIASNHPFLDANKRTAFVCMLTFLRINGFSLGADENEKYTMMIDVASGAMSMNQLADWLGENSIPAAAQII